MYCPAAFLLCIVVVVRKEIRYVAVASVVHIVNFLWMLNWTNPFHDSEHSSRFMTPFLKNHHRIGRPSCEIPGASENVCVCVCVCVCVALGPGPHSLKSGTQSKMRGGEPVNMNQLLSYFVEEQWQEKWKIVSPTAHSCTMIRRLVSIVLEFPVSLHTPADLYSLQRINTNTHHKLLGPDQYMKLT